ncbi:MAG: hypothetical protein IKQ24_09670 [Verrucomicrobia bacterium]|nr:hypothetical protein [Verrucomicrobiota bacterium]
MKIEVPKQAEQNKQDNEAQQEKGFSWRFPAHQKHGGKHGNVSAYIAK